jgi:hypothetical protein
MSSSWAWCSFSKLVAWSHATSQGLLSLGWIALALHCLTVGDRPPLLFCLQKRQGGVIHLFNKSFTFTFTFAFIFRISNFFLFKLKFFGCNAAVSLVCWASH